MSNSTETADTIDTYYASASLDPTLFVDGELVSDPAIFDCTLSDGTETSCHEIVIAGVPANSVVGPFCPETITSTAADSGIWQDGNGVLMRYDGFFMVGAALNIDWLNDCIELNHKGFVPGEAFVGRDSTILIMDLRRRNGM